LLHEFAAKWVANIKSASTRPGCSLAGVGASVARLAGALLGLTMRLSLLGRFLRPLLGIVVAYAVAAQALLVALGGFAIPASANDGAPAFTLCLHDSDHAPSEPAGIPGHNGCSHCVFCFAGAHQSAVTPPPVVVVRVQLNIVEATWVADEYSPPRLIPYAIARPRGPPLDA
jgi:hypothetical protein